MKWTDGMREQAVILYANKMKELGEKEFYARFETIQKEVHKIVESSTPKRQLTENELAHKRRMIRRQIRITGYDNPIKQNISLQQLRELARDLGLTPFNACIKRSTTDFTYCRLEKGHSENCSFPEKTVSANFRLIHISTHSEWMVQPFDTWDEAVEGLQKYSQGGRKACVIEDKDGNRWTVEEATKKTPKPVKTNNPKTDEPRTDFASRLQARLNG